MKLVTQTRLYSNFLILFAAIYSQPILANNEILLNDVNDKQHALSEYIGKGQWTVVNLWGVDCPPCREEMPDLVMLHDEYHKTLVSVLGIAIDFPSFGYPNKVEVKQFLQELMVDFPILLSDESISGKLDAGHLQGLPTTYIFNPKGELVAQQVGGISRDIILDFIKKHDKIRNIDKNKKN